MDLRLLWDYIEPRRRHPQSVLQCMPEIPDRDDANRRSGEFAEGLWPVEDRKRSPGR